ncbi:hypothetical protein SDC9_100160 [bioreactor metagenome]|uniref:Uncharacterized protein n=1 Tax=bioreactor metagenome TaxID=1076179 RepID=A0A645AJJ6_9ZZZZ
MKPKKSKGIRMPRSDSRKYKRYRQMHPKGPKWDRPEQEHQNARLSYFGEMQPRREDGVTDLTPYAAAIGQELISTVQYDNGRSIVKRRGRPIMRRAL